MPTFVSGPAVASEDYLAGGLYFFVIDRLRLELGDDGTATRAGGALAQEVGPMTTQERWRAHVDAWKSSGLSCKAYASK